MHFKNYKHTIYILLLAMVLFLPSCAGKKKMADVAQIQMKNWSVANSLDSLPISSGLADLFDNSQLDSLLHEALTNNHNLKATALRLQASELRLSHTRASMIPSANINFTKGRSKQIQAYGEKKYGKVNSHQIGTNISWEIDIWGKLYETHQAAVLNWEAEKQDYLFAKDALAARLIQTWVNLISSKTILQIRKEKLESTKSLNLSIIKRYREGLVELDEYNQSAADYEISLMNVGRAEEEYLRNMRELEILLGREPQTKIDADSSLPDIKAAPLKIPSVVLANRPDVKAGIARLNSVYKISSSSKKEMLPGIELSADLFKNSASLENLLSSNLLWNVMGQLAQPVFNAGRIRKESKAKSLDYEAALSDFRDIVYNALKEVEYTLGMERELKTAQSSIEKAYQNYKTNRKYYEEKYSKGLVEFRYLLEARQLEKDAAINLSEIKANRLSNRVNMALALGYSVSNK